MDRYVIHFVPLDFITRSFLFFISISMKSSSCCSRELMYCDRTGLSECVMFIECISGSSFMSFRSLIMFWKNSFCLDLTSASNDGYPDSNKQTSFVVVLRTPNNIFIPFMYITLILHHDLSLSHASQPYNREEVTHASSTFFLTEYGAFLFMSRNRTNLLMQFARLVACLSTKE